MLMLSLPSGATPLRRVLAIGCRIWRALTRLSARIAPWTDCTMETGARYSG